MKFNGGTWNWIDKQVKRSVELGENFQLNFDLNNPSLIELYDKKTSIISSLQLYDQNTFVNNFPFYIAYSSTEYTTHIIAFDKGNSICKKKTFKNEKLLSASNYRQLMTLKHSTKSESDPYEVIMRSTASFLPKVSYPVVAEEKRTSKNEVRLKKFERDFTSSKKLTIIPNGNKSTHGWIEQILSDDSQETKYFDSEGNDIKSEVQQSQNEEKDDYRKTYADSLLYDRDGTLQICNFTPYKMSEDVVGYHGFEDYEKNEGWTYEAKDLVKQEVSYTGRNFVKFTTPDSSIARVFTPKNQKEIYTASAWLRTSTPLEPNKKTPFFKAIMSVSGEELFGLLGKVEAQAGEWSRVAVEIDLVDTVKKIYDEKIAKEAAGEYQQPIFSIKIVATGITNSTIDVDSIAFHPTAHRLEANVFNELGDLISTQNADHSVDRFFYNPINMKMFAKTKNNKVQEFIVDGDNSALKITPESGFHESFDVSDRWLFTNQNNFKLINGKLQHDGKDGSIESSNNAINDHSAAVRLEFALTPDSSINFSLQGSKVLLESGRMMINGDVGTNVSPRGEILILKHEKRFAVWINGDLKHEEETFSSNSWNSFKIEFKGEENCLKIEMQIT